MTDDIKTNITTTGNEITLTEGLEAWAWQQLLAGKKITRREWGNEYLVLDQETGNVVDEDGGQEAMAIYGSAGWRLFAEDSCGVQSDTMHVVYFADLPGFEAVDEHGGISKTSFGDAEFTLVWPAQLIAEIENWGDDDECLALLTALKAVPEGVYVALDG